MRRGLEGHTVERGKSKVKFSPGSQGGKTQFPMSSHCGGFSTFTKDSAAGIVEEGLQPGSLGLGTP